MRREKTVSVIQIYPGSETVFTNWKSCPCFIRKSQLRSSQGSQRSSSVGRRPRLLWAPAWANWRWAFHKTGIFGFCIFLQSNVQLLLCIFAGQVEEKDAGTYSCQATYATIQEIEARVNDSTLNQQHFFNQSPLFWLRSSLPWRTFQSGAFKRHLSLACLSIHQIWSPCLIFVLR